MRDKICLLIKKYGDVLVYLIFGVLTTAVDWVIFTPLTELYGMSATLAGVISWVGAVAFAYLTNKPFVFKSHDWSLRTVIPELMKFVGTRLGSLLAQSVIFLIFADWLGVNSLLTKAIASVFVVILNYVGSKLLVFRKK